MELRLNIIKATNTTIGDIRSIEYAIERLGFSVEVLPSEISPQQFKITKEDKE